MSFKGSVFLWEPGGVREGGERWYPPTENAAISVTDFLPEGVEDGMTWRGSRSLLCVLIAKEVMPLAAGCFQLQMRKAGIMSVF